MTVAVKVYIKSIKGSSRCQPGEKDSIVFARFLELDGMEVYTEGEVKLTSAGSEGFLMLELHRPTPERLAWMRGYTKSAAQWRSEGYDAIRALFADPDDYMEGTDDDVLILGVRSIEYVESKWPQPEPVMPPGVYSIPL